MAYFNHAFYKSFLASEVVTDDSKKTIDLGPGQLALVTSDWTVHDPSNALPTASHSYLVQGSFRTQDRIGNTQHGGYTESIKSKGINPKYLTRIWESECITATASTATIEFGSTCHPCDTNLQLRVDVKGSPALRFLNRNAYATGDSNGDVSNGTVPGMCCADGQTYLDPVVGVAKAADMILRDEIVKPFITERTYGGIVAGITASNSTSPLGGVNNSGLAITSGSAGSGYAVGDLVTIGSTKTVIEVLTVSSGAVATFRVLLLGHGNSVANGVATTALTGSGTGLEFDISAVLDAGTYSVAEVLDGTYVASTDPVTDVITGSINFVGSYVDTRFGNSSFDTRDFFEKEPVQIYATILDETGDPCNDCGVNSRTEGTMQQTIGEGVLRRLILTDAYMQNPFNQGRVDSNRIREIEGSDKVLAAIDREALYKVYYVQHSIPRFMNPTSTFDNDQYVYEIFVKCSDTATQTAVESLLDELVTAAIAAGNPIVRETSIDIQP